MIHFGYLTEMKRSELLQWIDRRLEAKGLNDSSASIMAGHRDAIRNIRRSRSLPKIETIRALVEVLGDPPVEALPAILAMPERILTLDELRSRLENAKKVAAAATTEVQEIETTISTLERLQKQAG